MDIRYQFERDIKIGDYIRAVIIDGSTKTGRVTGIEKDFICLASENGESWPLAYILMKEVQKPEQGVRKRAGETEEYYGFIIEKKIIRNGDELGIIRCCNDTMQYKFKAFNIRNQELADRYNEYDKDYLEKTLVKFKLKRINPEGNSFGADYIIPADLLHDETARFYLNGSASTSAEKGTEGFPSDTEQEESRKYYGFLYSNNPLKNVGVIRCRMEDGTVTKYRLIAANILDSDLLKRFGNYAGHAEFFRDSLLMFEIGRFENGSGPQECAVKVTKADTANDEKAKNILILEKKYRALDEQVNLINEWMMRKGNDKDQEAYLSIHRLLQEDNREPRICELIEKLLVLALRAKDDTKRERLDEVRGLLEREKAHIKRETYLDSQVKIVLSKLYDEEWAYGILKEAIDEAPTVQKFLQGISNAVSYLEYCNGIDNKGRDKELVDKYVRYIETVRENPQLADGKSGQFVNSCLMMYTADIAKRLRNIDEKNIDIEPELYGRAKAIIESDETAFSLYNGDDLFHCRISGLVTDILEGCRLPAGIRGYEVPLDEKGRFAGKADLVKAILPSGGEKEPDCPLTPEEYLLYCGRMYYDLIQKGELKGVNINRTFCPNIAKYLTRRGDNIRLDNDGLYLDMARTFYLECINFSCFEYIWDNSVVQIILTHLATRSNWNDRYDRLEGFGNSIVNIDLGNKDTDSLIPSMLGILDTFQSTRTVKKYESIRNKIFKSIFIPGNIPLIEKVYESLRKLYSGLPEACVSREELEAGFGIVLEQYRNGKENFITGISELEKGFSFTVEGLALTQKKLKTGEVFSKYMLESDRHRYELLTAVMEDIIGFNSISDIRRINVLEIAIRELNQLADDIGRMPTACSYMLIPAMRKVREEAEVKLNELYRDRSKYPRIRCYVADGDRLYETEPGTVYLRIYVSNEEGCQNARNVKLQLFDVLVDGGKGCQVIQDERSINLNSGGGAVFMVKLTNIEGVHLSFGIGLKYSFNTSVNNQIEVNYTDVRLLNILKEEFTAISNPYKYYAGGSAVREESMFFGRKELIGDILEQLEPYGAGRAVYGKTIVLYGQKRTGKSSVKFHLTAKLKHFPDTIIIDAGEISSFLDENFEIDFLKTILNKLRRELKRLPELSGDMEDKGLEIPLLASKEKEEVWSDFLEFYDTFSDYLRGRPLGKEYNVFLIADEFSKLFIWLNQGRIRAGFMEFWKSFIGTSAISAIVVGQDYMPKFIKEYGNAFASMNIYEVTYLSEEAVREMMANAPLVKAGAVRAEYNHPAGESAVRRFMELTAGNAFIGMNFLDKLMDCLNETKRVQVTELEINGAMDRLLSRADIEVLFNAFHGDDSDVEDAGRPEDNKTLLKQIAKAAGGACREEDITGFTPERRKVLLKHLADRKVIIRNAKTGRYGIKVKLYGEWLRRL